MTRIPAYLLMSTLLSAGFALSAHAQSAPATPAPATATPAPPPVASAPTPQAAPAAAATTGAEDPMKAEEARQHAEAADRDAMFEAHLAALHAGLTLTPDQDRLWPSVEHAIRGFVAMRADLHDRRSDRHQDRADMTSDEDPIAALKVYSDGMLERAQALKALSTAAEPLYASLNEDQKRRLPMLLHDMTPRRGPVARMVDELDQDHEHGRGDRMEHHGMPRRWEHEGANGDRNGRGEDWAERGEGYDGPAARDDRRAGMDDEASGDGRWPHHGGERRGADHEDDGPGEE